MKPCQIEFNCHNLTKRYDYFLCPAQQSKMADKLGLSDLINLSDITNAYIARINVCISHECYGLFVLMSFWSRLSRSFPLTPENCI